MREQRGHKGGKHGDGGRDKKKTTKDKRGKKTEKAIYDIRTKGPRLLHLYDCIVQLCLRYE